MFANPLSCAHVVARVAKVLVKHYALLREMSQPPVGKRLQYTLISEYLSGIRLSLQTVYRDVFQKDKIASNLWDNSSTVALKIKQLKKDTDRMILRLSATQEYNIARSPNESTCLVLVEISLKWQDDFSHFKQLIVDVLNNVIKRLESIKIRSLYVAVKLQTFWKMLNDEPSYYQLVHELFELLLYFNEQRLENREGARLKVEYLIENIPFDGAENILQRLLKIQGTLIKSLDPLQDKHCMSKLVGAIDSCKVYTVNTGSLLANTENEKKAERIDQSNRYQRAPQTRELSQESLSLDEQLIEVVDNIDELLNDQSGIFLQPNDMECLSYIKRECENELLRARLRAKYLTDQSILLITAITNREGMGF
ncbi:8144_t:CDS:2 [Paraglomus occultum]|uniref:8144_t:CDS:1 n=1 Tax=Paraglomus occultum TaxID=144539 RepID=A0A9N8ZD54_9GLOM|nr:8144_t:CDS:2 [Paraglomus occultum]